MSSGLKKAASIAARSMKSGKPHHAQWLVTRKCNYRCVGCNVWKEQDQNELSTEEIKRGMDCLREAGIIELVLSGGDPLLRPDIGEIIDYASERFVTTVYDNGSMAAKKVDLLHKVDFVALSIDSLDEAKNDAIKAVPGAWRNAMNAVDVLQKAGVKVAVTPTISQKNLYEIIDITTYFTSRGIPVWYCLYTYDTSEDEKQLFRIGKANDEFVITDKKAAVKLFNQLMDLRKKNDKVLMTTKLLKTLRSLFDEEKRTWKCQALTNFLVVDHLGRIAGCHSQNFVGTVFDLPQKWNSEEFQELRKSYKDCERCNYLCYVFYSLYGSPGGHLSLAREQWKNAKLLLK